MPKTAAAQTKSNKRETTVVQNMTRAREIADELFGSKSDTEAVHEIYEYVKDPDIDIESYLDDVKCALEHAKTIHKTTEPTPEQVFGVFDEVFLEE
jgi:hypothetical protein